MEIIFEMISTISHIAVCFRGFWWQQYGAEEEAIKIDR